MTWQNRIVGHDNVPPDQLLAHPGNWRVHPKYQQEALRGVINDIGYIKSVTVNKLTGRVVDGHLRVTLALRDGIPTIPVEYVELTEAEEAEALLTLDPIAALAGSDKDNLETLLAQVQTDDAAVMKLLEDTAAGAGLDIHGEPKDAEPQIDRAAELLEKWQVKTGDLWQIGEHRLICGDCTDPAVVARVMGGGVAQMVFTSPPYGSKTGNLSGKKFYGEKEKDTFEDYVGFLCDFLSISPVENSAPVFVNLSYNDNQRSDLFRFAVSDKHGFVLYETFVWKKLRSMPLKGDNISRLCEFVFLFSRDRYRIYNRDVINLGLFNFYETKKENSQNRESGNLATFPIDFPEHFIDLFSLSGHVVYEPFCGTGTTLVACQNLGRRGRAVEISPAYCAVTLERMAQAFPGIEIKRL